MHERLHPQRSLMRVRRMNCCARRKRRRRRRHHRRPTPMRRRTGRWPQEAEADQNEHALKRKTARTTTDENDDSDDAG